MIRTFTVRRTAICAWSTRSLGVGVALTLAVGGCSTRTAEFTIVDYRESGPTKQYQESFEEAYYSIDELDNVDIVLRRTEPSITDADQEITQIIHLRTMWHSIPGSTVADRTQINGKVLYGVVSGPIGATFEGGGSVFFKHNPQQDTLNGTLESALLKPTRRLTSSSDFFKRAELSGEFHAVRDRRRVVRIIHDIDRIFGPLPPVTQRPVRVR